MAMTKTTTSPKSYEESTPIAQAGFWWSTPVHTFPEEVNGFAKKVAAKNNDAKAPNKSKEAKEATPRPDELRRAALRSKKRAGVGENIRWDALLAIMAEIGPCKAPMSGPEPPADAPMPNFKDQAPLPPWRTKGAKGAKACPAIEIEKADPPSDDEALSTSAGEPDSDSEEFSDCSSEADQSWQDAGEEPTSEAPKIYSRNLLLACRPASTDAPSPMQNVHALHGVVRYAVSRKPNAVEKCDDETQKEPQRSVGEEKKQGGKEDEVSSSLATKIRGAPWKKARSACAPPPPGLAPPPGLF